MDNVGQVVNMQMVGSLGENITVMMPATRMGKREALIHAAWLVALADKNNEFEAILRAVRNT